MKTSNEDKQERSVWNFPICSGKERIKNKNNETAHPTQKPLALMNRIILQSTLKDDLVLEPFAGTGSFCASAKYLGRNYIGFERDRSYQKIANKRLKSINSRDHELLDLNEYKLVVEAKAADNDVVLINFLRSIIDIKYV